MIRKALIASMVLALAACGHKAPQPAASASPAAGPSETVDLQAGGISLPGQDGKETLDVPFGSTRAAAEKTLAAALGPVVDRSSNPQCPSGSMDMTQYKGLKLEFQDGKLVGWYATAPYVPTETRGKLLTQKGVAMVADSTLGNEFSIGPAGAPTISGQFDGTGDNAHVSVMWAGLSCVFR